MELKRITASDSRSATAMAIARYGKDALIISNERCGDKVHVLVAIDNPMDPEPPSPAVAAAPPVWAVSPSGAFAEQMSEGGREGFAAVLQERMREIGSGPAAEAAEGRQSAPDHPRQSARGAAMPGSGRTSGHPAHQDDTRREHQRALELVDLIREEFSEMRREFRMSEKVALWQATQDIDEGVRPLAIALEEAGVPARLRAMLAGELRGRQTLQAGMDAIESLLQQCVRRERRISPLRGIHLVAGPSGAGKTLMLGKLALAHAKARNCGPAGVALIGFGDHGYGAWSQQQLLAARAGIECFRAPSKEDLREILVDLHRRPVVLIDLPGDPAGRNLELVREVVPEVRAHVLLAADSSAATFGRWLPGGPTPWDTLMLSKLDEAESPWALIQALVDHPLPLSFASHSNAIDNLRDASDTGWLVALALRSLRQGVNDPHPENVKDC